MIVHGSGIDTNEDTSALSSLISLSVFSISIYLSVYVSLHLRVE